VLGAEDLFGALDGQGLDLVDIALALVEAGASTAREA
jgi:hypothetical protein